MPEFRGFEFFDIAYDRGGPEYFWANDDTKIVRPIQVPTTTFNRLDEFVREFIGYPFVDYSPTDGYPYLTRTTPHPWGVILNLLNDEPFLYCSAITHEPSVAVLRNTETLDPVPEPAMHRMRLVYTAPTYRILPDDHEDMLFEPTVNSRGETQSLPYGADSVPDEATLARYVSLYQHPFMRIITIPRAIPKWVLEDGDAGWDVDESKSKKAVVWEGIGKAEPGMVMEIIWHAIPNSAVPWTAIQRCMGKVNGWDFYGFPEETLLCEAPRIVPKVSIGGMIVNDIHYLLRFLPKDVGGVAKGHNHFLRALKSVTGGIKFGYRLLTLTGKLDGDSIFERADFASLFRPEGVPI